MLRKLVVAVAALAATLAGPAAPSFAVPQPTARDSVSGEIIYGPGRSALGFAIDTSSGPSGESPTGTVRVYSFFTGELGTFDVSCLGVSGNRATIVAPFPGTMPPTPAGVVVYVEDNGSSGDSVDSRFVDSVPSSCPPPSAVPHDPDTMGDVTVVDAPPPPTRFSECRLAGWARYGFASHADCIAYVHDLARRKCIFERVATGIVSFRAKYGAPTSHDYAMRRCVRIYTGF